MVKMLNHKYGYRMAAASLLLVGLLVLAGCAASGQSTVGYDNVAADKNVLRVGVTLDAPPLIFKQNGKIVGLEAGFARALADDLGKALQFVELKWKNQIPALLENKIDIIMSGLTVTPLREVRIAFCQPYFKSGQMALIRMVDAARFSTGFFSLTTSSAIGAVKDTTGEYFVETRFSNLKRILFSTPQAAVKALIDKKIELFIYDAPMVLYLASENENRGLTALFTLLTNEGLAWGVRKDNPGLLQAANEFLENPANEKKLKQMIQRWIPFTKFTK
jgi:polar amino acid transport system substrate-binding protein